MLFMSLFGKRKTHKGMYNALGANYLFTRLLVYLWILPRSAVFFHIKDVKAGGVDVSDPYSDLYR